jgi:energy-coupling factor transporter transmembrane protein EcfT
VSRDQRERALPPYAGIWIMVAISHVAKIPLSWWWYSQKYIWMDSFSHLHYAITFYTSQLTSPSPPTVVLTVKKLSSFLFYDQFCNIVFNSHMFIHPTHGQRTTIQFFNYSTVVLIHLSCDIARSSQHVLASWIIKSFTCYLFLHRCLNGHKCRYAAITFWKPNSYRGDFSAGSSSRLLDPNLEYRTVMWRIIQ